MNDDREKNILILGVGNLLLGDEGVGVHVVQRLQEMKLPPEVEVVDGGTGGFELIEHVRGKSKVAIVDCLNADAPPGSVIRLTLEEVEMRQELPYSVHEGGIRELLAFIKTLTPQPEVVIFGIVPAVLGELTTTLSPNVQLQIPRITSRILGELSNSLISPLMA